MYVIGVIGVVKAGGFGHGSVEVSKHLQSIGVERLAVATIHEGIHLRNHGITLPVHVLGKPTDPLYNTAKLKLLS